MRRFAAVGLLVTAALTGLPSGRPRAAATSPRLSAPDDEVRALWVVRTTLTSSAAIEGMVRAASAGGFNTLLVQVRGRGDSYFTGGLESRAAPIAGRPAFDPLAVTIESAHAAGLRVHAWVNANLVSGANELPAARDHLVYRHPEWLMVPRALAPELVDDDPKSPAYVGRLARYARGRSAEIEGLYVSPIAQAAADYTTALIRDIVVRYPVDGVHLDYVRYPSEDFDYSRDALRAFRSSVAPGLAATDRQQYDGRLSAEPLIYTLAFPERWRRFRQSRLTDLVRGIGQAVRLARPGTTTSVAVVPDSEEAAMRRLQDWRAWLAEALIDAVCPMVYTTDAAEFEAQVAAARAIAGSHALWAGIGAYRLSPAQIVANVRTARRLGAGGVVLFSYDSLVAESRGARFLSELGRAAFQE